MDSSGSVRRTNFDKMKSFISELIGKHLDFPGGTRIGAVTFGTTVGTTINLNEHSTVTSIEKAIFDLDFIKGNTYTNLALEHVRVNMLTVAAGDRTDAPNVVVILTDGKSTKPTLTQVRVNQYRAGLWE